VKLAKDAGRDPVRAKRPANCGGHGLTRRQWLTRAAGVVGLTLTDLAEAEETRIPARLQAELLAKVAAYDGRFLARAGARATVLVVVAPDVADSERFGAQIRAELSKQPKIGGIEHMEEVVRFSTPAELSRLCKERKVALVYLAPGLSDAAQSIATALTGMDVLSVSAMPDDVAQGIVLGFELVSGKPKLLVHLAQARRQNVAFKPELLRLARVIQ
jgi:YfiR/HmsC-like